ncbi:MAG: DUF3606 domain-containing protein [Bacteroidia bacterium]
MSDNLNKKGSRDGKLISLTQDWEVKYWAKTLACSVMELTNAVKNVGHSAERVRDFLRGGGNISLV